MAVLIELNDDRSETIQYDSPDYPIYIRGTFSPASSWAGID